MGIDNHVDNPHISDLGEDRTLDPLIKSQLLYRLSYQVVFFRVANKRNFFVVRKTVRRKVRKIFYSAPDSYRDDIPNSAISYAIAYISSLCFCTASLLMYSS